MVPRVKRAVQSLSQSECQKLVADIMELDTSSAILARCTELAQARYGEVLG
jgi:hypothetical protein